MKKTKFLTLFAVFFIAFNFASCDNEPIDPAIVIGEENPGGENPGETNQGTFTAKIDGVDFVSNGVSAMKISDGTTVSYTIRGSHNSEIMIIQFFDLGVMSYDIPDDAVGISYIPNIQNPLEVYAGISPDFESIGNMTVTANDETNRKISGTFNCVVSMIDSETGEITDTKQISNGEFINVLYTIN